MVSWNCYCTLLHCYIATLRAECSIAQRNTVQCSGTDMDMNSDMDMDMDVDMGMDMNSDMDMDLCMKMELSGDLDR